ncbi:MAG: VOC family protein [Vicinamibacterales bacterium]
MPNPVTRWQIVAPDPGRVAAFYENLFGWTVRTDNALGYRQVETGDGGMPGGIWPLPSGSPAMVQLFVEVDDISGAVARATSLGAVVVVPVSTLPDGDTMAILADPAGLTFGLHQRP